MIAIRKSLALKKAFHRLLSESKIIINGKQICVTHAVPENRDKSVLLMPGALGSAATDFKPQLEKLQGILKSHNVIGWDPIGYGKSRPPDKKFNINFFKEDAEIALELMHKLCSKPYALLGWSDGGITAMIMAGTEPSAIDKLVIWGSNAYIIPDELKIYESIRDVKKWSQKMREPMEKVYGAENFARLWSEWIDVFFKIYKENNGDICKRHLPYIVADTLIIHGAKDPMIAAEHVPYLAKTIKNSQVHIFPDGKHNVHLRYADEFNQIVAKFLNI